MDAEISCRYRTARAVPLQIHPESSPRNDTFRPEPSGPHPTLACDGPFRKPVRPESAGGRNGHQWIFPPPKLTMVGMNPDKNQQFLSGADWVRVDFHLHTMADREFQYAGDDSAYNSAYINALEQSGIRLGVITNKANGQWCTGRGSRNPGRGIYQWR